MVILGIDPGASGGIALFSGKSMQAWPTPDIDENIVNLIKKISFNIKPDLCIMEQVGGYVGKKQPGSSMFNFGDINGFVRGVIKTLDIPVEMVTPQKWQKSFSIAPRIKGNESKGIKGETTTEWKKRLLMKAQSLYPMTFKSLLAGHAYAIADAVLIAEYGRRLRLF